MNCWLLALHSLLLLLGVLQAAERSELPLGAEQHLLIDWTRHFSSHSLSSFLHHRGLQVLHTLPIHPIDETFRLDLLSVFYQARVLGDEVRGRFPFTVYVLLDREPRYEYRLAGVRGLHLVNVNLWDVKKDLRQVVEEQSPWLGNSLGQGFHATDHISETKRNLQVLGLYENESKDDVSYYTKRKFDKMSEVFDALNSVAGLTYVVLRNFENLPESYVVDEHSDVDLLVSDYFLAKRILDGDAGYNFADHMVEDGGDRVLNFVSIGGREVMFDIRFVGDDYFDIRMERGILSNRERYRNFYIPNSKDYVYSLLYHVLIHKDYVSDTYKSILIRNGLWTENNTSDILVRELFTYLKDHGYQIVPPNDRSIHFNRLDLMT